MKDFLVDNKYFIKLNIAHSCSHTFFHFPGNSTIPKYLFLALEKMIEVI